MCVCVGVFMCLVRGLPLHISWDHSLSVSWLLCVCVSADVCVCVCVGVLVCLVRTLRDKRQCESITSLNFRSGSCVVPVTSRISVAVVYKLGVHSFLDLALVSVRAGVCVCVFMCLLGTLQDKRLE